MFPRRVRELVKSLFKLKHRSNSELEVGVGQRSNNTHPSNLPQATKTYETRGEKTDSTLPLTYTGDSTLKSLLTKQLRRPSRQQH